MLSPRGLYNHKSKQYIKTKNKTIVLYNDLIQHETHSVTSQKHDVPYDLRRTPFMRLWVHNTTFCRPTYTVQYTVRRTQFSIPYDAHSSVHCTTQTVQVTVRRTQFSTLYDAHSSVHCTMHTVQYTVRRTQFSTLYDAHSSVVLHSQFVFCIFPGG